MIRDRLRHWLQLPTHAELERENKVLRRRILVLRDALQQVAWRARMNMHLIDNQAAHNVAVDTVARDLKMDLPR